MEIGYYMGDVLESVHSLIRMNGFKLSPEVISEFDEKIQEYVKSKVNIIASKNKPRFSKNNINKSDLTDISLEYFAMINDNTRLLNILREHNFRFSLDYKLNLYVLDKGFSSRFSFNKYIDMLLKHEIVFRRFYSSIRGLEGEEREKSINAFAEIISAKPSICDDHTMDGTYEEGHFTNLLIDPYIKFFGKDFLLNSNIRQRKIINSLDAHLNDEELNKVFELLKKYPNFDCKINLSSELLSILTIDEIVNMSEKDVFLYKKSMSRNYRLVSRMHNVLLLNPNFNCTEGFIRPEIFKSMSDEVIAGLSAHAIEEIEQVKIPFIDNVYVMPIRKINRIVAKDERMKRKIEKKKAKEEAKRHR